MNIYYVTLVELNIVCFEVMFMSIYAETLKLRPGNL